MRMYSDLASWWPLLSPPSHYVEEAADLRRFLPRPNGRRLELLELGSGGGSLVWHLKDDFALTLTDLSPEMLAVNQAVNPEAEFHVGDMRTIDLGPEFDVVLLHDAVMYLTTPADLLAAFRTAARHCRPGGTFVVLPDCVRESFEPSTDHGGEDGPDGRGLRYLEWSWDPDPADATFEVAYALTLREPDGTVRVELDRHREGLFSRAEWLALLEQAGFEARSERDPWRTDVFVALKPLLASDPARP
jgi:SAM-dependent methyltransferase